ncbi:MAG: hypothetical protein ABR555_04940 [Pyrinomonadaceae bacterium]
MRRQNWHIRSLLHLGLCLIVVMALCVVEVGAQSRRKRHSRRARKPVAAKPIITNPPISPPTSEDGTDTGDVKIISTSEEDAGGPEQTADSSKSKKTKPAARTTNDQEDIQQTMTTLSNQVNKLTDKLTQMQEDDRYLIDMERLTRAEQRSEQLRSQLIEVQSKMADLQSRLEQIEYASKPENIERATMSYGTVHPEEARESRRRQLESEKGRLQVQLNILDQSRNRLEQSIATADSEVDLLRARLNQQRDLENSNPKPETRPRKPPE